MNFFFISNWTSGTSLAVDEEEYYSHLPCDVSTSEVENYTAHGSMTVVTKIEREEDSTQGVLVSSDVTVVGDGTVTLQSATVNHTLQSDKVYVKTSSNINCSGHTQLIDGNEDGIATLNLIIEIIQNNIDTYDSVALRNEFGVSHP